MNDAPSNTQYSAMATDWERVEDNGTNQSSIRLFYSYDFSGGWTYRQIKEADNPVVNIM